MFSDIHDNIFCYFCKKFNPGGFLLRLLLSPVAVIMLSLAIIFYAVWFLHFLLGKFAKMIHGGICNFCRWFKFSGFLGKLAMSLIALILIVPAITFYTICLVYLFLAKLIEMFCWGFWNIVTAPYAIFKWISSNREAASVAPSSAKSGDSNVDQDNRAQGSDMNKRADNYSLDAVRGFVHELLDAHDVRANETRSIMEQHFAKAGKQAVRCLCMGILLSIPVAFFGGFFQEDIAKMRKNWTDDNSEICDICWRCHLGDASVGTPPAQSGDVSGNEAKDAEASCYAHCRRVECERISPSSFRNIPPTLAE